MSENGESDDRESVEIYVVTAPNGAPVYADVSRENAHDRMDEHVRAGAETGGYAVGKVEAHGIRRTRVETSPPNDSATTRRYTVGEWWNGRRIMLEGDDGSVRTIDRGDVFAVTRTGDPVVVRGYDSEDGITMIALMSSVAGPRLDGLDLFVSRLEDGQYYPRGMADDPESALLDAAERCDERPGVDYGAVELIEREQETHEFE